jgi:hypothetical protein
MAGGIIVHPVPFWFHLNPMLTLTLKNIPKDLHLRLKASAEKNRRSLNSEILTRLESDFAAPPVDPEVQAGRLHDFTARLPRLEHRKIDRYKRQGRA